MNGIIFAAIMTTIVIIVGAVIYGAYWYFSTVKTVQEKNTYCENWFNNIEDRRIQLENEIVEYNNAGFWEQMQTDPDYLNSKAVALDQEGNQYNRECAY